MEIVEQALKKYEPEIKSAARRYFYLYKCNGSLGVEDLEQAARITVFNIQRRRPDKIGILPYVKAAIRYAIFGEIRKMKQRQKNVYLVWEDGESIPLIDVLPSREETIQKIDELEEILYYIKHEFSDQEAHSLESLLERCENIFDLNLSEPPVRELKDRIKVVTRMDLTDEEMAVYAEVLLGLRGRFPSRYLEEQTGGKERAGKYLQALLDALDMSVRDFAHSACKKGILDKYKMSSFLVKTFHGIGFTGLIQTLDPTIDAGEIYKVEKWKNGRIPLSKIRDKIREHIISLGKDPKEIKVDNFTGTSGHILEEIFAGSRFLALEFAFPGTFPAYRITIEDFERVYNSGTTTVSTHRKRLGFRGFESPLEYFKANRSRYDGLTRSELAREDNQLYKKLREAGQIHEAIPIIVRRQWKKEGADKIEEAINGLAKSLNKEVNELTSRDFDKNGFGGLIRSIFKGKVRVAQEFINKGL